MNQIIEAAEQYLGEKILLYIYKEILKTHPEKLRHLRTLVSQGKHDEAIKLAKRLIPKLEVKLEKLIEEETIKLINSHGNHV